MIVGARFFRGVPGGFAAGGSLGYGYVGGYARDTVIVEGAGTGNYNGFPSQDIDSTRGKVVAVFRRGTHYSATTPGTIFYMERPLGTNDWSTPVEIINTGNNTTEASIKVLSNGDYVVGYSDKASHTGPYTPEYVTSSNGGSSWSAANAFPDTVAGAMYISGQMLEADSGRLIQPAYDTTGTDTSYIYYAASTAGPWTAVSLGEVGYNETELWEEDNGDITAWMREQSTGNNAVWRSKQTTDEGATWGSFRDVYSNAETFDNRATRPNVFKSANGVYWSVHRSDDNDGAFVAISLDGLRWAYYTQLIPTGTDDHLMYGSFVEESGTVYVLYGKEYDASAAECDIRQVGYSTAAALNYISNPPTYTYSTPTIELDADGETQGIAPTTAVARQGGPVTFQGTLTVVDNGAGTENIEVGTDGMVRWPNAAADLLLTDTAWTFGCRFVSPDDGLTMLLATNGTSSGSIGVAFWIDDRNGIASNAIKIRLRGSGGVIRDLTVEDYLGEGEEHTLIISHDPTAANHKFLFALDGYPIYSSSDVASNWGGAGATDPAQGSILTTGGSTVSGEGEIARTLLLDRATHDDQALLGLHQLLQPTSSIPPNAMLDADGNPMLDADGNYILNP